MKGITLKNRVIACTAILLSSLVLYCPDVWARCSLNIQNSISSGWNKHRASYTVEKNTLKIKVAEGGRDDADSIFIGSIKGCSTLTINVSQISGKYPWGGKVIGFSFANDKRKPHQWGNFASFAPPRGHAIEDGFVKAGAWNNKKFVYDIDNSDQTTYIGAKVFIGSNNALELQFSAQEASPDFQLSARQPSPSENHHTTHAGYQTVSRSISCSLNCHEPRSGRSQSVFTRIFSRPSRASCRD